MLENTINDSEKIIEVLTMIDSLEGAENTMIDVVFSSLNSLFTLKKVIIGSSLLNINLKLIKKTCYTT